MDLRRKVEDFLITVPQPFQDGPKAVLSRIASPNFEFFRFLDLSWDANLPPLIIEYFSDKFVTHNVNKLSLT
jgi:hypothetical protein